MNLMHVWWPGRLQVDYPRVAFLSIGCVLRLPLFIVDCPLSSSVITARLSSRLYPRLAPQRYSPPTNNNCFMDLPSEAGRFSNYTTMPPTCVRSKCPELRRLAASRVPGTPPLPLQNPVH